METRRQRETTSVREGYYYSREREEKRRYTREIEGDRGEDARDGGETFRHRFTCKQAKKTDIQIDR